VCAEHTCRRYFNGTLEQSWKRFDHLVLKRGYRWYGRARVWQEETLDTYVSLVWDPDGEEPWLLISDEGAGRRQVQVYAWRMRVEATFQESKSRGFNILRQLDCGPDPLGSLAAGIVSSHVVGLASGSSLYPSWATSPRMTRVDRRDKSIFRLGRLWLLDILRRVRNRASLRHGLPFQKTNTGWRFA